MKKMLKNAGAGLVLGLGLMVSHAAGHDLWLNMTDYTPAIWQHPKYAPTPRAKTVAYVGWGHSYPMGDFVSEHIWAGMQRIEADGSRVDLEPGKEGFRAVRVDMDTPGPRIFAAHTKPGFYEPVEGKKDFYQIYYEKYAKALVSVLPQKSLPLDGPEENPFIKPIGHKVEIIPMVNPNRLQPGSSLEVLVLVDGKPAEDYELAASSLFAANAREVKTRTDKTGKGVVVLEEFYGPWIVKASRSFPPTGDLAAKCASVSYTATLTFALPYVRGN